MKIEILQNIKLAQFTSIHLGGIAQYFFKATSEAQLIEAFKWAKQENIAVQILGGGSNTIFNDNGFNGLVLQVAISGIQFKEPSLSNVLIKIGAGENWDDFVFKCCERGLAGIECLSGIPGTVGATPIQNVGAYGQEISQCLHEVTCINRETLETQVFTNTDCSFEYRQSRFKQKDLNKYCVTQVSFKLHTDDKISTIYPELRNYLEHQKSKMPNKISNDETEISKKLLDIRAAVIVLRRKKGMLDEENNLHRQSCGSYFLNPILNQEQLLNLEEKLKLEKILEWPNFPAKHGTKIPAAWLIEQAGFTKGFRYKGVGISPHHALALINYSGTTQELLELQKLVVTAVLKKFNILLHHEPVIVAEK